jgi:(p)ppGpp synthase/HD superfamily hydrolase
MKLENKAWLLAQQWHKGQLDDDGNDYFKAHLVPVADILYVLHCSTDVICAGYLHDVLEDTKIPYEMISSNFNRHIADLVLEVTHEGDKNKGYYFPRLHSKEAIIIKFADNLSNLTRMDNWAIPRQEHHLKKSRFWKVSADDKTR